MFNKNLLLSILSILLLAVLIDSPMTQAFCLGLLVAPLATVAVTHVRLQRADTATQYPLINTDYTAPEIVTEAPSERLLALQLATRAQRKYDGLREPSWHVPVTDLSNADLAGANLEDANLEEADFEGSYFEDVNPYQTTLTPA